jgi:hypothetical protein
MSSFTTLVGVRPRTGMEEDGGCLEEQAASVTTGTKLNHSRSCPARRIGAACEPWCHAFPCPSWCTGVHRSGNHLYHLAAPCPPGCAGHPNGETDFERAHDGWRHGVKLALIVRLRR